MMNAVWGARHLRSLGTVLLVFAVVVIGSAAGVYIGHALTDKPVVPATLPVGLRHQIDPNLQLVFEIGNRFPNEPFVELNGSPGNFEDLFDGRKTVLLFWSFGCEPCFQQADNWNKYMSPLLRDDVKVIVCLADKFRPEVSKHRDMLKEKRIVFIDGLKFLNTYNLAVMPTIVVLDGQGFVFHIQYEAAAFFDRGLVELVTNVELSP